jgi:crotonobetainyl-CoA:carnitine CoA-transferase CaiB-like acyl-CoA transferase
MSKNETTKAKPMFVAKPMSALPKREAPKNEPDLESAKAVLALLSELVDDGNGNMVAATISDGAVHATVILARANANKAKRLLAHVLPDGKIVKTRVYPSGDGHEWAVWIADEKPEKKAK